MDLRILWSSRDWADAVAALPAVGPLPCRTVLVPRVGHGDYFKLLQAVRAQLEAAVAGA